VALCKRYRVRRLAVFGSVLRAGFYPASSGVDFALEFAHAAEGCAAHPYSDFKAELEALLGCGVDLVEAQAMLESTGQIPLYAGAES
jgi:predicted nucleotidyltransferase